MKNKLYGIFLVILLLPLLILNVNAEAIDPSRSGSILGLYKAGSNLLTGVKVSAYKIANVDTNGTLTYAEGFTQAGYELNGLTSSQLNLLLNNLEKYIDRKNIEPTKTATTDNEGKARFNDLGTGMYLVITDIYKDNNYTYQGKNLVSIPNLNQNTNAYIYDIEMVPKIDIKQIENQDDNNNNNNNNNGNNKPNVPNTYDSIYVYFGIFFVTILVIAGIVYYISKTKRSEEK